MCGGFVLALDRPRAFLLRRLAYQGLFHLGKTTTYVVLGLVVGLLGAAFVHARWFAAAQAALAVLAGALMVLAGLQIGGWLKHVPLGALFGEGSLYDRLVRQFINVRGPVGPLALGMLTGLLPCPLVYAFVSAALAQGSALAAMGTMASLGTGLGTRLVAGGPGRRGRPALGTRPLGAPGGGGDRGARSHHRGPGPVPRLAARSAWPPPARGQLAPSMSPTACEHCGLPAPAHGPQRRVDQAVLRFCCLGCSVASRFAGPSQRGGGGVSAAVLARLALGVLFTMLVMLLQVVHYVDPAATSDPTFARIAPWVQALATLPVLLLLGVPIFWHAFEGLRRGRWGVDALVGIALLAGYIASLVTVLRGRSGPLYFDTVAGLATLMTLGRWLEASAKRQATQGLRAFLSASGRVARRMVSRDAPPEADEHVSAEDLAAGAIVRVLPGMQVPADGHVIEGHALMDEAALTGESQPRPVHPGAAVRAPTLPLDGPLVVQIDAVGGDTLLARIAATLQAAQASKAPLERLADRVATVFVPAVVVLALGVLAYDLAQGHPVDSAVLHALSVLVVACPCALGIATPLAVSTALGRLAERGVLVRTGEALAELPRVRRIAFDKTGTLTTGRTRLAGIEVEAPWRREDVLAVAAAVEAGSEHPLARGIRDAAARQAAGDELIAEAVEVVAGRGGARQGDMGRDVPPRADRGAIVVRG